MAKDKALQSLLDRNQKLLRHCTQLNEENAKLTVENDILRVEMELLERAGAAAGPAPAARAGPGAIASGDAAAAAAAAAGTPSLMAVLGHEQGDEEEIFPGLHFSLLQ